LLGIIMIRYFDLLIFCAARPEASQRHRHCWSSS
jgi:hypothetical protein